MIEPLSRGSASVSELAGPLDMSLPAAVQHLSTDLVYSYTMHVDGVKLSASLTTLEFDALAASLES